MKYFLGSLSTLIVIFVVAKFFYSNTEIKKTNTIRYSQTHIYELIKPLVATSEINKVVKNSQSKKYNEKINIKVIIMDDMAYWIKDNIFYMANMVDGFVDKDTTRTVDTMAMNKVQLDKMLFIMDRLREGKHDDSGNSGNK
jgi:hypothetical protein